jgi:precorrin-4/cobalt-precorrin-4 C11-methyltransferase
MTVHFIGAGPGAADLITLRGRDLLARCPVCLYAGSIVPPELLSHCPLDARLVDTAPMTLDQIEAEYVAAHAAGQDVARLHSGDLSLYSAVAEQSRRLDELGIDYEIVPGVPAFAAAAAVLGRELTVPGVAQSVTLTRVATLSTAMPPGEDLAALSAPGATLVLHLAAAQVDAIVPQLFAGGYHAETPCAVVAFASWPQQKVVRCTLAELAEEMHAADITRTAVIVVGDALAAEGFADSYLYSSGRVRGDRGREEQGRRAH